MDNLGESNPGYISSPILSQKIKEYHNCAKELMPYLRANTSFLEVDTQQPFAHMMTNEINKQIEPTIVHIRPGANSNDLKKEITENLVKNHGYINLELNSLVRDENERKTAIGVEIH